MLCELEIKDILLIKNLSLAFSSGLNAFTGETGTGKSILLDCLGFVLGARGQASIVRSGSERGEVTAIFSLKKDSKLQQILEEADIPKSEELILRRVNFTDGRKSAWVNEKRVSSEFLRLLGDNLIEFHGQHDERGLLDSKGHLQLLDQFANLEPLLILVKQAFLDLKKNQKALETFIQRNKEVSEEEDLIKHNLKEISDLGTYPGEEAELDTKRRLMQNSQTIRENILQAGSLIGREGAEGQLNDSIRWLEKASAQAGNVLDDPLNSLRKAQLELLEAQSGIENTLSNLSFNSEELEIVEDRLFSIRGLSRKYKVLSDQLPELEQSLLDKLSLIETGSDNIEQLKQSYDEKLSEFNKKAENLSLERQKAASILDKMIEKEFLPLKMERARFKTELQQTSASELGKDNAVFTISTNPGSKFDPLMKIASGGELSRFLLALKVCLTSDQKAGSIVFDEIDRGVGGATADAVGRRLLKLAESNAQVLAVTHSPQVAALADTHFMVSKETNNESALSHVNEISGKNRVEEIARMISGDRVTDEAREASRVLIAGARRRA